MLDRKTFGGSGSGGGAPSGAAGGDLAGTYPNPTIKAALDDPAAATPGLRTLGTGAAQAAAGNDSRLSDSRAPSGTAGGDLAGTYPNPTIKAALADPAAGTAGLRTLGTGATQAAAGTDSRLSDSRAPSGAAGGALAGTYPNPTLAFDTGLRQPVLVASTANVTVPPGGTTLTIDGVALANGDRVLLKDQTAPAENGIRVVGGIGSSVTLARATDADAATEFANGCLVTVLTGTVNAGTRWALVYPGSSITLDTTALRFTRLFPAYDNAFAGVSGVAGRGFLPSGVKIENLPTPQFGVAASSQAPTSGTLRATPLGVLRAGDSLASVTFVVAGTAGATLTHRWAGIARVSDRLLLAVSADDTSAAMGANALHTFTFGSAFTADWDQLIYAVIAVVGTGGVTMPGLSGTTTNGLFTPASFYTGHSTTGLTTPLTAGSSTIAALTSATSQFVPKAYAS